MLTDTTAYRRVVKSSGCSDISNAVIINVHKPITNYNISFLSAVTDTTLCYNQTPNRLTGDLPSGGTNIPGSYTFLWLDSTAGNSWNAVPGLNTGINYDPAALTETTFYKRQVISGGICIEFSNIIEVNVLPLISNNIISSGNPGVCYENIPGKLTGTEPIGGSGIYSYKWEQSVDGGSSWTQAEGINDLPDGKYQPPSLIIPTKYKRIVKSGDYECCEDISDPLEIIIYPLPENPYAGPDATIFSGDNEYQMQATEPPPGETGLWSSNAFSGSIDNDTQYNTYVRDLTVGVSTSFLWTVTRGECKLMDSVDMTVNLLSLRDFTQMGMNGIILLKLKD